MGSCDWQAKGKCKFGEELVVSSLLGGQQTHAEMPGWSRRSTLAPLGVAHTTRPTTTSPSANCWSPSDVEGCIKVQASGEVSSKGARPTPLAAQCWEEVQQCWVMVPLVAVLRQTWESLVSVGAVSEPSAASKAAAKCCTRRSVVRPAKPCQGTAACRPGLLAALRQPAGAVAVPVRALLVPNIVAGSRCGSEV